jgi:sterol desaturase/sphingolipid hydroxylase (fatty acid hydroxylase superfamily)
VIVVNISDQNVFIITLLSINNTGVNMAATYSQIQPPPEYMALYGLTKFKQVALMQIIGTVLMTVTILALFASLPFYGVFTPPGGYVDLGGLLVGPVWFMITVLFTMISGFVFLFSSIYWLTAWKPPEFQESSRPIKTLYTIGSILLFVALVVMVVLNTVNTPSLIEGYSIRESLAHAQIWPILITTIGAIIFYIAWIEVTRFTLKISEVFSESELKKLAPFISLYGSIYLMICGALLTTYYSQVGGGYGASLIEILKVTLGLSLLIAIIELIVWLLIYSEIDALVRKIQAPKS